MIAIADDPNLPMVKQPGSSAPLHFRLFEVHLTPHEQP